MNVEYVIGSESHTSTWGKFFVKGLESFQVKEEFEENTRDKHASYQGYVATEIPEGTIFTVFEQSGDKRGTDTFVFMICQTSADAGDYSASYGNGRVMGNFKVITEGRGATKAPRLMNWWNEAHPEQPRDLAYALHCAAHVDKRGIKALPEMPKVEPPLEQVQEVAPTVEAEPVAAPKPERDLQWINPWDVKIDAGTQSRKGMSAPTVQDYIDQMKDDRWIWDRYPLPVVFKDESGNLHCGDGHHRLMAAQGAEMEQILVEIKIGTLRDAVFFSAGANKFHGLARTNADKRNQVELLLSDPEWQQMSDRAIAEHCNVSAPLVGKIRAELQAEGTVNSSSQRVTKSGRKIETGNIGTKPKAPTVAPEAPSDPVQAIVDQYSPKEIAELTLQPAWADAELQRKFEAQTKTPPLEHAPAPKFKGQYSEEDYILAACQKLGAKQVVDLALDECSLDEVKALIAEWSSIIAAAEKGDWEKA